MPKSSVTRSRVVAGSVSAGIIAVIATGAFAYWGNQSATGSAAVGSAAITIQQTGTPTGLVPGGNPKDITLLLKNDSSEALHVQHVYTRIKTNWSAQNNNGGLPACTADDFKLTDADLLLNRDFQSGETAEVKPRIQMKNDPNKDQENCKNAAVDLVFTTD